MHSIGRGLRAKAFGEYVKEARLKAKITQTKLAEVLNVDQKTVSMLESGQFRFFPPPGIINELAFQLDIPARWLVMVAGYKVNGTEHESGANGD